LYLASALTGALIAGVVAPAKRRHPGYWLIFSFLIPPIVLVLLILPKGHGVHNSMDPYLDRDDRDDLL
jgi:uncharacterized membrane protein